MSEFVMCKKIHIDFTKFQQRGQWWYEFAATGRPGERVCCRKAVWGVGCVLRSAECHGVDLSGGGGEYCA